jgi:lipoprotein NlpD
MISILKYKFLLFLFLLVPVMSFGQAEYDVAKGDTLYSIAKKNGVRVEQIRTWNKLNGNALKVGQKLVLGEKPARRMGWHTVRHGETLWRIAYNFRISIRELMDINGLTQVGSLKTGQKLKVPMLPEGKDPVITRPDHTSARISLLSWPVRGTVMPAPDGKSVHISCAAGEKIRSAADGSVEYIGSLVGYKNVVIIRHPDELYSIYGALGGIAVVKGDKVDTSTVLGEVEKLPHEQEPFLYFELVKNGQNVDPSPYLK